LIGRWIQYPKEKPERPFKWTSKSEKPKNPYRSTFLSLWKTKSRLSPSILAYRLSGKQWKQLYL